MSPRGLLERLVDFERRICRAYLTLGDRSGFPSEARFFWNCMAEDERHHVAILERSAGLLDLMEAPPQIPEEMLATVEAKVAAAEAALQQPSLTLEEALHHALLLEGSELNSLDEAWFQGFRPTLGSLLHAMMPETEIHLRRVVEAVQSFSSDPALRQQAEALWAAYQRHRPGALPARESSDPVKS